MAGALAKFRAPGLKAPKRPKRAQIEAVERLVREQVAAVQALTPQALRAVIPVLRDAIEETRAGLHQWLSKVPDGAARFTAYDKAVALRSLEAAFEAARELEPAMVNALGLVRHETGPLAMKALETQIARFGDIFGEPLTPPQLNTASVIATGNHLLIDRHATSAARYAGGVRDDIKHQLAVGVASKETFSQLTNRLRRLGGPSGVVALRGKLGDPGAVTEHISEGLFRRYHHWAERLVRTELMESYNLQHDVALLELNGERDEGEEAYLRRWDASADRRVCPICADLDERVAPINGTFPNGKLRPPAHPHCRCVLVAWHASWGNIVGEVPLAVDVPGATPPKPAPAPASAGVDREKVAAEMARRQAEADEERRRFDAARRKALAAKGAPADPAREALPWEAAAQRGDLEGMRAGIVADLQRHYGLVEQTWREHRFGVRVDPTLDTPGALDWTGVVLLDEPTADHLAKFGRASADDRAALFAAIRDPALRASAARPDLDLMEVHAATALVHESVHAHGALTADIYAGKGATIEEIATETLARRYMVDRLGAPRGMFYSDLPDAPDIPSIGAYNDTIDPLVNSVARDLKISRHEAAVLVEDASIAFKRLEVGTTPTIDSSVEYYLDGLPAKARNNARKIIDRMGAGEVVVVPAPVAKPAKAPKAKPEKLAKVAKPKPEKAAKPAPAPKPAKPAKPKAAPKKTAADRAAAAAEKKAQAAAARAAAAAEKKRIAAEAKAAKAAAAKEAKARAAAEKKAAAARARAEAAAAKKAAAAEKKAALAAAREAAKAEKARIAAAKKAAAAKAKKPAKAPTKKKAPAKGKAEKVAKAAKPKAAKTVTKANGEKLVKLPAADPYSYSDEERAEFKQDAMEAIVETRERWWSTKMKPDISDTVDDGFTVSQKEFFKIRKEYANDLAMDELDACLYYSHKGDGVLNSGLRYGLIDGEPDVQEMAQRLTSAIKRYKMPEDTYVARGLGGEWAQTLGAKLKPGDVFREPGFSSTSATGFAEEFAGEVRMRIRIPKGAHAAPIPTRYAEEYEFLLPPGTKFRVVSKRKVATDEGDQYHLELEVVDADA